MRGGYLLEGNVKTQEVVLAMNITMKLEEKYPQWGWWVGVNGEQRVVDVKASRISQKYGMRMHMSNPQNKDRSMRFQGKQYPYVDLDYSRTVAVDMAGQFLERARVKIGAFKGEQAFHLEGERRGHAAIRKKLGVRI